MGILPRHGISRAPSEFLSFVLFCLLLTNLFPFWLDLNSNIFPGICEGFFFFQSSSCCCCFLLGLSLAHFHIARELTQETNDILTWIFLGFSISLLILDVDPQFLTDLAALNSNHCFLWSPRPLIPPWVPYSWQSPGKCLPGRVWVNVFTSYASPPFLQQLTKVVFYMFLKLYSCIWWEDKSNTSYFGIVKTHTNLFLTWI